ncbi:MAG: alpha/beta fold hydrolase [Rhizobiaceae bacterium]|nr:alpha/beta fold hydrolase [Rhizobiaceae bacterium]
MAPEHPYREMHVNGMLTRYIDAGEGDPLVLLHGGEFGANAQLGWERVIGALAERRRVIAPDVLGFGGSAKVLDFVDGRGMRTAHVSALLSALGIGSADFAGNSMGGVMLLNDAASDRPLLPVRSMTVICGGGEILKNEHVSALYDYDATLPAMRRIVAALFHDPAYAADDAYVLRRYESSMVPGAWEAVAAARFRRPGPAPAAPAAPDYGRIARRSLIVEGEFDKLKPRGWAAGIAASIPDARSFVVSASGHCPQIEQPAATVRLLEEFFAAG